MTWLQWYQLRHFIRNSIWLLPVVGMATGLLVVRALHRFESAMGWEWQFQPEGARAVLGTLGLFLCLIDHFGKALRPSGALHSLAQLGNDLDECAG